MACVHEEPVRPSLEATWIAELREVLPDREQRLLRRVLGEVLVAQDPARDREEPIGDRAGKEAICRLVAALSSFDQIGVHLIPADGDGFVRRLSHGYESGPWRSCQSAHSAAAQ